MLNFGHSFGHLFETETNYSNEILHGEAVALGMAMASKMSLNFDLINIDEYQQIIKHLKSSYFKILLNQVSSLSIKLYYRINLRINFLFILNYTLNSN